MHWFLSKLESYGNRPAIISEGEITYAELVNQAQNLGTNAPIEISNSPKSIISIIARLNGGNINFSYIDSVSINKIYSESQNLMIIGTSGTSGKPKQVIHDLDKFLEQYRTRDKKIDTILIYPLDHIAGLDVMFNTLISGGKLVIPKQVKPEVVVKAIDEHNLNLLACTPTFLRLLLISGLLDEYRLPTLKLITYGAEPMPEALLNKLIEKLPHVTFRQTYGTTETGVLKINSDNTVWLKPNNSVTLKGGELGLKLPDSFLGYIDGEANIEKGYIYLGDTYKLTRDEVTITGRNSDVINVGGHKVTPMEIETLLYKHPEIKWCKVKGDSNALMGTIVVADVYTDLSKEEVRAYCQQHLPDYKVPQKITIVNQIPVTDRWKS